MSYENKLKKLQREIRTLKAAEEVSAPPHNPIKFCIKILGFANILNSTWLRLPYTGTALLEQRIR